jgi:hypothetical protein
VPRAAGPGWASSGLAPNAVHSLPALSQTEDHSRGRSTPPSSSPLQQIAKWTGVNAGSVGRGPSPKEGRGRRVPHCQCIKCNGATVAPRTAGVDGCCWWWRQPCNLRTSRNEKNKCSAQGRMVVWSPWPYQRLFMEELYAVGPGLILS